MNTTHLAWIVAITFYGLLSFAEGHLPPKEKTLNFAAVYATQWSYYLIAQKDEIKKNGSFDNWARNPFSPNYDHDSFNYNLVRHTFVGHYYYLFYRSRNYSEQDAFIWTTISSFAFEFTIETVTEKPSYQDLYQTPVFGTVLGVAVEKLSLYLHSTNTWLGRGLGYLLNPFTLLPPSSNLITQAHIEPDKVTALVTLEF